MAAYRLLPARGSWDRLPADLVLVADPESRGHSLAVSPCPKAAEVRQALRAAEQWLESVREVAFVIG